MTVRPDGKITVKLAGELSTFDRTPLQLAQELDHAYSKELIDPTATVHVKASSSRQLYVEARLRAGSFMSMARLCIRARFPSKPRMSALQAIAVAGGLMTEAASDSAALIRRDPCGLPAGTIFDIGAALSGAKPREDLAILPGDSQYEMLGFLGDHAEPSASHSNYPVLGDLDQLGPLAARHPGLELIIAAPDASVERQEEVIRQCETYWIHWRIALTLLRSLSTALRLDLIGGVPLIGPVSCNIEGLNLVPKRAFDLIVALVVLLLALPVMALATLAI